MNDILKVECDGIIADTITCNIVTREVAIQGGILGGESFNLKDVEDWDDIIPHVINYDNNVLYINGCIINYMRILFGPVEGMLTPITIKIEREVLSVVTELLKVTSNWDELYKTLSTIYYHLSDGIRDYVDIEHKTLVADIIDIKNNDNGIYVLLTDKGFAFKLDVLSYVYTQLHKHSNDELFECATILLSATINSITQTNKDNQ